MPDVEEARAKVGQAEDEPESSNSRTNSVEKGEEPKGFKAWHMSLMRNLRGKPTNSADEIRAATFPQQLFSEIIGTTIYVFFGLCTVAGAITAESSSGTFQILIVWAVAVALAIITTVSVSGAHLNPAITVAFTVLRPDHFPAWKAIPYMIAQIIGGMIGAGLTYVMYGNAITQFESINGIVRGEPSSALTAMIFHGMYPPPSNLVNSALGWSSNTVTTAGAFGIEALGTGFIVFIVFVVMDPRNILRLGGGVIAYSIGLAVMIVGCTAGPLENLGLNPARDLGPRIVAYSLGWGEVSLPGEENNMWVYLIAPIFGGLIGGALYDWVLFRGL